MELQSKHLDSKIDIYKDRALLLDLLVFFILSPTPFYITPVYVEE